MTKLALMCATFVLVAGVSVQAQKEVRLIGPPIPFNRTISIEDDTTGNFLMFELASGEYKFIRCGDQFILKGVGFVKIDGCSIQFEDLEVDHRVVASVNECAQEAKAIVETFGTPSITTNTADTSLFKAFLIDANIGNNLMDCAPKK
jgi:hypothetical protein